MIIYFKNGTQKDVGSQYAQITTRGITVYSQDLRNQEYFSWRDISKIIN